MPAKDVQVVVVFSLTEATHLEFLLRSEAARAFGFDPGPLRERVTAAVEEAVRADNARREPG